MSGKDVTSSERIKASSSKSWMRGMFVEAVVDLQLFGHSFPPSVKVFPGARRYSWENRVPAFAERDCDSVVAVFSVQPLDPSGCPSWSRNTGAVFEVLDDAGITATVEADHGPAPTTFAARICTR